MRKEEILQKLTEVDEKLKAFGDLNALIQQGQSLPNLANDLELKKTNIESFLTDLPTRSEELNRLTGEVKSLSEQVTTRDVEVSELVTKTEELQGKAEKLVQETQVQLGVAANAKLASTFESVKDKLEKEKEIWFGWLKRAVGVLVVATGGVVLWQIKEVGTLYHLSFPIRLALLSPIVYSVVFVNREYSRARSLIEEYTFKAAVARSFEAYKEIVQSADSQTPPVRTVEFVIESIKNLYSSPMFNIKSNAHKEKENASEDMPSIIRSTIKDALTSKNDDQ